MSCETPMILQSILSRLQRVRAYSSYRQGIAYVARCPAHDDRNPSLVIALLPSGKILFCCNRGCTVAEIVKALGVSMKDLFPRRDDEDDRSLTGPKLPPLQIVQTFNYLDETGGKLIYQVCRMGPIKTFRQRRVDPETGLWVWNLEGVTRVLYRLPDLAKQPKRPVWIVEGEKDCDALKHIGLLATTNSGGAGRWDRSYNTWLEGREVTVVGDDDEAGSKHAEAIAGSLLTSPNPPLALRLIPRMPDVGECEGGDVGAWLSLQRGKESGEIRWLLQNVASRFPWWKSIRAT